MVAILSSVVSLGAFCLSKTVQNVLVSKKNDLSDTTGGIVEWDLAERIMLIGLVVLEFCRSWVLNGSYGLMVT